MPRGLIVRRTCTAGTLAAALTCTLVLVARQGPPPPTPAPRLAAGTAHSIALDATGGVWAWGANLGGQLGDGSILTRTAPVPVASLSGTFTAVAAGGAHSLALRSDGRVWGWGLNLQGEVGDGSTTTRRTPVQVASLTGVVTIAAGATHSLALRGNGTVAAWGANNEGQLGDNSTTRRTTPVTVSGLTNVVAIAAGGLHSMALKADGTVWVWGANVSGQIGDNTFTRRRTPVRVTTLAAARAIAAGGVHSVAVTQAGAVFAWGGNLAGQLGDGSILTRKVPVAVPGLTGITSVSAGLAHSAAVGASGGHWAWGANLGQLGDGSILPRRSPVSIASPGTATLIAAGDAHSLALTEDGTVWSTGVNLLGPLGSGTIVSSVVYAPISGPAQTWGVSPPTFSPAGGTFTTPLSIGVTTPTPGATIRYTTTGADPTTSDAAVPSNGMVAVDRITVLKARAFRTGLTPSAVTTHTYTLQVDTPSISPGTGAYPTPQTVTLATTTPGASLFYTTDGTDPTTASTPYTGSFGLTTSGVLKVRGFRSNWAPSPVASATFTYNFGVLTTPVATPPGGAYQAPQTVVLGADAGAAIHYTLDGTAPTEVSPLYTAPLTIGASTTLNARAFRADWTPSDVLTAQYVIDTSGSTPGGETPPPDPSTVAPPLSQVELTPFEDQVSFLYAGPTPIQFGVTPGTLQDFRVAVLRGKVLTRDGQPLAGARVSVAGQPGYGFTISRMDGMFDLVVNGGGPMTLDYTRNGFLPVQRIVDPPWHDYAWAPDVRMVQLDTNVTTVDFSVTAPAQAVRGSVHTDASGTRQATLIVPAGGVMAAMTLPDGTGMPNLAHLDLRATEYTVGPDGPQAMPGELPTASGYTYAVELSADEAIATGATSLTFDPPLPLYVENFLDFPVGGIVPAGYYDRTVQGWLPSDNGRIVQVLSVDGAGRAELDIDGSGQAADATALAALGVTDGERTQLAALYEPGQSLWRTPIPHFSPWDCNWPYGPPAGAESPNLRTRSDHRHDVGLENNGEDVAGQTCVSGSIVGCDNQTLGETVPLAGTPYALHYDSARAEGSLRYRSLDFPISNASISPDLQRIEVDVAVAGQLARIDRPAAEGQSLQVEWSGTDAYGRPVRGWHAANVRVKHVYDVVYLQPAAFTQSFGRFSSSAVAVGSGRTQVGIAQDFHFKVRGPIGAQPSLGQWSISPHHSFDDVAQTLYPGSGGQRSAVAAGMVIATVAGGGNHPIDSTGVPAREAALTAPKAMAVAEDGDLYFVDDTGISVSTRAGSVRRVWTFASGASTYQAEFSPQLAAAPGGGVYFTRRVIADTCFDTGSFARVDVLRVTASGTVTTVAHADLPASLPCNTPLGAAMAAGRDGAIYVAAGANVFRVTRGATAATLFHTTAALEDVRALASAPDGGLYLASFGQITRLDASGNEVAVAGSAGGASLASVTSVGDGGPATNAPLEYVVAMAVDRDGTLFVLEARPFAPRIRSIRSNGVIQTLVGGGLAPPALSPDGSPGRQVQLHQPQGIAAAPDGTLFVNEFDAAFGGYLRRLQTAYRQEDDELAVPSEDGSELYQFAPSGRHLRTLDTLTGVVLHAFTYDADGRLETIVDREGLVTRVVRAGGVATAIESPFGPRTTLSIVGNELREVVDPESQPTRFTYLNGQLASMQDANGGVYQFGFSAQGRLESDVDPEGGTQTLSRVTTADGWAVTRTASGVADTVYATTQLSTGDQQRVVTHPDGTQTIVMREANGQTTMQAPDGTVSTTILGPDPRFGLAAPLVTLATVATPGGLQMTAETTRSVTLAVSNDPLSVTTATETTTINGRVYSSLFTAASRTITSTSPEGRQTVTMLDLLGRPSSVQVGTLTPTTFHYDTQGRLAQRVQGSRTTTFTYDGHGYLGAVEDPLTRTVSFTNDAVGRALTQTFPDSRTASFRYDGTSNLQGLTPPGRPEHQFGYSGVNTLASYTPPAVPGAGATTYAYDLARRPTTVTRADGQMLTFGYEPVGGRLDSLTTPSGVTSYSYEPGTGRLDSITAPGGTLSYGYDGALLLHETWSGSVAGEVAWAYDGDFRVVYETVDGASGVTFGYDQDGLLTSAGEAAYTRFAATGLLESSTVGDVTTTFGYNGFGELTSHATTVGSTPAYGVTLTRDGGGRITTQAETLAGVATTDVYGYDTAGRLQTVTRNGTLVVTYGYDANGNRTSTTTAGGTIAATYDAQDRIQTWGTRTYTHTAHGDVASWTDSATSTTTTLTYDVQGNLRQVQQPGTTVTYTVDGRNRRIGVAVNGTPVQRFLWQGQLRPVAELDGAGTVVSRFVYGTRINVPEYLERDGTIYRLVTDHLGSVRSVIDTATNTVAQALTYDPWGVVVQDTNPGFQPFGYAGGLYDYRTGLVRFGVRDYDAVIGRWLAKDPVGFEGNDANLYSYALGDPVNYVDPQGTDIWSAVSSAARGVVAGVVGGVVVGTAIASGTAVGAAIAVGTVGYGSFLLGQGIYEVATGTDWSTGDSIGAEARIDIAAELLGGAAGGALFCASGPAGPILGRGKYRNGSPGVLNRGDRLRLGWSWHEGLGRNMLGPHGGVPQTPSHWHRTFIPGPKGPTLGPFRW